MNKGRTSVLVAAALCAALAIRAMHGQDAPPSRASLPMAGLEVDHKVPTLEQVVGFEFGTDLSTHTEIEQYLRALAEAASFRARLVRYGETWTGRGLHYLVISSPSNIDRLEEIRAANLRLCDPRRLSESQANELVATTPAIVWFGCTIHGNETSGSEAALVTAYHLLADGGETTRALLNDVVVIIDTLQNPDGRDRFVHSFREARGLFPDAEPLGREHGGRWASGRLNHYLFDMNRDWFLHSQKETRARVAAYLRWRPHVFVDVHEMGRDQSYFFPPPTDPINPMILETQRDWFLRFGKHQAARFDEHGFAYTTRELFDAFYPGYGESWPTLSGAIGMLWEQAGVRGLVVRRSDELRLTYRDAVLHHYVSALATVETASRERRRLVADFVSVARQSVALAGAGDVSDYFLLAGEAPARTLDLVRLLARNGIDVARVTKALRVTARDVATDVVSERDVPIGSYHVSLAQPSSRLARTLLDRHTDMGEAFVRRQLERRRRRVRDEIYDVTSWSLPFAFAVDCLATVGPVDVESDALRSEGLATAVPPGTGVGGSGAAKVAYLVPGRSENLHAALSEWLRADLRVHVTAEPMTVGGVELGRGSLVLKVAENPDSLHERVQKAARRHALAVRATDTGFVDAGAHLGGPHVRWVRPPRIAMLFGRPLSTSAGHTWFLFDRRLAYPVTRISPRSLGALEWSRWDVLIFPHGRYDRIASLDSATRQRLQAWIREGGTLVLVEGAAEWASQKDVGLLAARPAKREVKPAAESGPTNPPSPVVEKAASPPPASTKATKAVEATQKRTEKPPAVPGAFLRATVYPQHFVAWGLPESIDAFFDSNLLFTPLSPLDGRALVRVATEPDRVLASGFCWPETLEMLPGRALVLYRPLGKGHIVAFADDPNFRAMYPRLQRLFFNAVMFGPGS